MAAKVTTFGTPGAVVKKLGARRDGWPAHVAIEMADGSTVVVSTAGCRVTVKDGTLVIDRRKPRTRRKP